MTQAPLPTSSPGGWTPLAHGEQEHDAINRCPAGHVHLDYGNVTVRFQHDEFLAFARMVIAAAQQLTGNKPPAALHPLDAAPSNNFSLN